MTAYQDETIRELLEGVLPLDEVAILQREKDDGRLAVVLRLEQERLGWSDRIILPLQENLFIVERPDGSRIVRCGCGQDFGDYRVNWKESALVYERHPQDGEVFLPKKGADPDWQVLREFYCPSCATLLDVEPVPVGYPFVFNFLPDLGG
jgi:acetone carboxylase, gamma subunit